MTKSKTPLPTDHVVKSGDTLRKIADEYGFVGWKKIWLDEANKTLRDLRKYPGSIEPDDKLHIPARVPGEFKCSTGSAHRFRIAPKTDALTLVFKDDSGIAMGECKYSLKVGSKTIEGKTDADGVLDVEVPAITGAGQLTIWMDADPETLPNVFELVFDQGEGGQ